MTEDTTTVNNNVEVSEYTAEDIHVKNGTGSGELEKVLYYPNAVLLNSSRLMENLRNLSLKTY
jgi:hypothetical protein